MRLCEIREHKPKVLWVAEPWKRWLRRDGKIDMFLTRKACEKHHQCKAVKLLNYLEETHDRM